MPRYFFDVYDGIAAPDAQGHECADLTEARRIAAIYAAEHLQSSFERLWRDGDWTVWVRDEEGLQRFSIVILGMVASAPHAAIHFDAYGPAWKG